MGLMITYATLNYARNMIWERPKRRFLKYAIHTAK
jgi:hypothetical protein